MRKRLIKALLTASFHYTPTKRERRRTLRDYKRRTAAAAGSSPDTSNRKPWKGKTAYGRLGGHFVPAHPLRAVDRIFGGLTERGMRLAMNLKFAPPRTQGSEASLRAYPRGLPGQGAASWLPKPELERRIKSLNQYLGVKQYV